MDGLRHHHLARLRVPACNTVNFAFRASFERYMLVEIVPYGLAPVFHRLSPESERRKLTAERGRPDDGLQWG